MEDQRDTAIDNVAINRYFPGLLSEKWFSAPDTKELSLMPRLRIQETNRF